MDEIKKSPIQIVDFKIRELTFKVGSPSVRSLEVPIQAITLNVSVQAVDDLNYSSLCGIEIGNPNQIESDFYFAVKYQIDSRITDIQLKDYFEKFVKFGAPFHALSHAREMLSLLSTRAFGRAVSLPLLDITELGKLITIKSILKPADHPTPSPDKEPSANIE